MIHFIRPEWLLGLLPLILLSALFWRRHQQQSAWKQYIAPHLSPMLISDSVEQGRKPKWMLAFCWLIAVLALSGPAITKQNLPVFATEQGRVLVMDMSYSMYATDLSPNRLSHARFRATDLLSEIKEGETGLIAYAGDAFTISPLTRDNATLLNLLPTLTPDIMPSRGSNLSAAITLAEQLLAQGGHITGDIILMTDGVSDDQFNQVYSQLKNSRYRLSILAFGSQNGAPIKLADGQLMRDSSNEVVVAKTDIRLLQKLAKRGAGIVIPTQADGSDIKQLSQWLAEDGQAKATELEGESWQDLGPYLAILLLLPMLLSFKHGILPNIVLPTAWLPLAGLIGLLTVGSAYSPSVSASVWDDLWLTKDQQAQQAFEQGDYQQAAKKFSASNWQASAHYKAQEYQKALEGFELDDTAQGLYNQANSLMQLSNLPEAIKRYQNALSLQPDFTEAQENLALAEELLKQQAQNDQQNGQQGDPQSNEQNSEDQQAQQQDQQQSGSNTDPNGQQSKDEQQQSQQQNEQSPENAEPNQNPQTDEQQQGADTNKQSANDQPSSQDEQDGQSQQQSDKQQSDASSSGDAKDLEEQSPENEASMQANTESQQQEASDSEKQQNVASPASEPTDKPTEDQNKPVEQAISPTSLGQEPLPENMERALRAISEDPQVLIRNKMQLEYQKRRQQNQQVKETEQW
ncbi:MULTISPECIES: vWA domain-containing protein [Pseudomonadati]|uniref:VWA domain-containing protein n=1 Tax=Shewanella aestuarii TaxID=1028752 RepID=A0ABT0L0Y6_9GAMM|nr:VWA domain-containing protein [Shewanella aestuarii]MCL1117381.1 VWA domain-containing protein [Shewanella aestuarii]GGN74953.1 hypothetical protein GCM10009193_14580 [Shewanella aestuarii]